MALFAKFNIGGYSVSVDNSSVKPAETFNVLNYRMITKCSDDGYHPTTAPKSEFIEVVLKDDTIPMTLYKWYRKNNRIDGCIDVDIPDGSKTYRRMIVFEGAQCFYFNEKYSFDKPKHRVTLRIAVEKLLVQNNVYQRDSL